MAHDTLYAIGEALIDMIPSKTGCSFAEVPSFSPVWAARPPTCAVLMPVWAELLPC